MKNCGVPYGDRARGASTGGNTLGNENWIALPANSINRLFNPAPPCEDSRSGSLHLTFLTLALLAAAPSALANSEGPAFAQLMIQQRVVIRIPATAPPAPPEPRLTWRETKGPKCLAMAGLSGAGAAIMQPNAIDLFLRNGTRFRARLNNDCPAMDFYSGFYLTPNADGRICVGRDMIHARTGGQCNIEKFRTLVPGR